MKRSHYLPLCFAVFSSLIASCSNNKRPLKTGQDSVKSTLQKPMAAANPIIVDTDPDAPTQKLNNVVALELVSAQETLAPTEIQPTKEPQPVVDKPASVIENVSANTPEVKDAAGNIKNGTLTDVATKPSRVTYVWQTSNWDSCSVSCGTGSKSRAVACKTSKGRLVADSNCTGTKPSTSESCFDSPCVPRVTCAELTITVDTNIPDVTCTDTLPLSTVDENSVVWSKKEKGTRNLGFGCLPHPSQNIDTSYFGTVSGGTYGFCTNYCAVKAKCTSTGWVDYGFIL